MLASHAAWSSTMNGYCTAADLDPAASQEAARVSRREEQLDDALERHEREHDPEDQPSVPIT